MRRIVVALALAGFAACSSSSNGGGGSAIPEAEAGLPDDAGEGDDGGGSGKEAGPGCIAEILNQGNAAKSTPRPNAVAWQTPESALAADGTPARADLGSSDETELLVVTDFRFMPPPNMRIAGVEVELKREAPGADVVDGEMHLVLGDQQSPNWHYLSNTWPTSIFGTHVYGDIDDLWGMTLAPTDVTRADFGVSFFAKRAAGNMGSPLGLVDSIKMTITYCPE
ncbi:MAG TPA: hypothetical protein VIF62_24485 [Labilithrix sp.]|jgi:hypothetical protein